MSRLDKFLAVIYGILFLAVIYGIFVYIFWTAVITIGFIVFYKWSVWFIDWFTNSIML